MATGKQVRAARALLGWDAKDLAKKTGIAERSILNHERGDNRPKPETMEKIVKVFADAGIEFTEGEGVRRRIGDIEVFEGHERFQEFTNFIYEELRRHGGDVCISAADERLFAKYRGNHELHRQRMKELVENGKVTFRILASESTFTSEYAEHRILPGEKDAAPTSFYAFGNCLALISFVHNPTPYVVLHKSGPFSKAFQKSFDIIWEQSTKPPKGSKK